MVPRLMDGFAGVTVIETSSAGVTVRVVLVLTEFRVAEMSVFPVAALVAKPCEPAVLLIWATPGVPELHCTTLVMFCVLPSV